MSWLKRSINKLQDELEGLSTADNQQAQQAQQSAQQTPPPIPDRPSTFATYTNDSQHPRQTPENELFFQAFEWHTRSEPPKPHETHSRNSHWGRLARILPSLAELGVTSLWLPPGCKANNPQGNGYDCYDLWDLGEFDQKWTRSTKWGSREELRDLVETAKHCGGRGVELIWDAVLNHKTAGDATDETWAVEVDHQDRRIEICAPKKIEAWLKYDFPGREREGMKYSSLKWRAEHFSGTDWDQRAQKNAIYKLIDDPATYSKPNENQMPMPNRPMNGFNRLQRLASDAKTLIRAQYAPSTRPGKGWMEDVDKTFGNYDYLLFSNVYYAHPEVRQDVVKWGQWMIEDIGINGFRLDAAQHFSWNFTREWIGNVHHASRKKYGKDAFVLGEVLSGEVSRILRWLDFVTPAGCDHSQAWAFDAPLLYSFSRISEDVRKGSRNADLRTLLSGPGDPDKASLVSIRPYQAFTFVTNHDTQTNQSSFTPMNQGLKSLFYAFILLRREGKPCVFWGDLYGTLGDKKTRPEAPACRVPVSSNSGTNTAAQGASPRCLLPSLMLARRLFAYGEQRDYFDSMSCIGWTRSGTHDRPGCVVIMSIGKADKWTMKRMIGGRPGEKWVDVLSEREARPEVIIDEKGEGVFAVKGRTVSVYVREDCEARTFSVPFNHDVYSQ
ncbi:Alpha-amylase [Pseudocercospora fuligena]|uniref:Alpha-amylase n=1 Tax=Pseudocercospora fuligena TaxID=685502 RepID=A0A8H6VGV1_9PEZI|nr:Alpha-amylase [Pseudocercospora fuligena]